MVEAQAVSRVHRMGQQQNVVVTRYITANSIENVKFQPWSPLFDTRLLTQILQKYVQWIQQDKLRLIQQSLGVAMPPQREVDNKRWKVSGISELLPNTELTMN
jgi:hypothetical protein